MSALPRFNDCRDRTSEYFDVVKQMGGPRVSSLSSSSSSSTPNSLSSPPAARASSAAAGQGGNVPMSLATKSQFAQAASHVSKGIYAVSEQLEVLTKLAQRRSLFDDQASEINRLTATIKNDLQTLNQEIELLHQFAVTGQHPGQPPQSAQSSQNSAVIVQGLKSSLASTTRDFATILQVRTTSLREQRDRRSRFEDRPAANKPRTRRRDRNQFGAHRMGASDGRGDGAGGGLSTPLLLEEAEAGMSGGNEQQQQQQRQEQQQASVDATDAYLESRAVAVQSIESTIQELGQMYQRLSTIVGMQEDVVIRIDSDVTASLENVQSGHTELLKYYEGMSSNQWLMLKVFAILIMFSLFFVVFVA